MNKREEIFVCYLENQGKCWIFEPIRFQLKNTTYTPDFYCPDEDVFYEVVGTRQAISQRAKKIAEFIKTYPHIQFKLVHPNGKKYNYISRKMGKRKDPKDKMVFFGITINPKLLKQLNQYAKDNGYSVSFIIREALKSYLPLKYYNDSKGILRGRK